MFEQGTFHCAFQCEIKRMQFYTRQAADFQFQLLDGFRMTAARLFFGQLYDTLCNRHFVHNQSFLFREAAMASWPTATPPSLHGIRPGTYNGIPFAANKRCNCSVNLLF